MTCVVLSAETEEGEIEYEFEGRVSPLIRGRYSGPPELCHPDEGGEVEIEAAYRLEGEGTKQRRVSVDVDEAVGACGGQEHVEDRMRDAAAQDDEDARADAAEVRAEARAERLLYGDDW